LLLSGAMPGVSARLASLNAHLPLGFIEISHFLASLVGIGLLFLARGLQRRLNAAYSLALALLAVGVGASLFKGLEWAEAAVLLVVFLSLLPCRSHFYRKSKLINQQDGGFLPL